MSSNTPPATAVIVAGGDPVPATEVPALPEPRFVIAADSGLHAAQALGMRIDLIVGDLDSASPAAVEEAEQEGAAVEQHPADKDATDLELALSAALVRGLSPTIVLGGAGFDRIDHLLANALLLARPRFAPLRLEWFVKGARVVPIHDRLEIRGRPGDLVTLVAAGGAAHGVSTAGLRWELQGDTLEAGSTRGVSNEMTSGVVGITVERGTLLAVHTKGSP